MGNAMRDLMVEVFKHLHVMDNTDVYQRVKYTDLILIEI